MTMAAAHVATAASHATTHTAASQVVPSGNSNKEQQILLMMILAAVIIFIQHDSSGQKQDGTQYAALGVVGFILLVIAQFWAEFAFGFAVLFLLSVILNSPNGIPLVSKASTQAKNVVSPAQSGTPQVTNSNPSVAGTGQNSPGNTVQPS